MIVTKNFHSRLVNVFEKDKNIKKLLNKKKITGNRKTKKILGAAIAANPRGSFLAIQTSMALTQTALCSHLGLTDKCWKHLPIKKVYGRFSM